ncbi:OadG family protein [Paraferrimonas sedimenticola]|uniref:Probable oxaloacetate decarboxylase gamma chain n=1 Tax=Paraferrimonas sedimenticola TaxID=375674 RepID=A0AA37W1I3_9GAMM|nr:OadG family transporter subunit [Paraferrimonas sedimenticola]GLP96823.1 hypothetical protein GCM10007895_21290 [Paraferrimonas sedimenticola]
MENMSELLAQAGMLMLMGMGLVFIFLSLLILTIKLIAWRFAPTTSDAISEPTHGSPAGLDPSIVAAISVAVNRYRRQKSQ